jgi:hypothetical protein
MKMLLEPNKYVFGLKIEQLPINVKLITRNLMKTFRVSSVERMQYCSSKTPEIHTMHFNLCFESALWQKYKIAAN